MCVNKLCRDQMPYHFIEFIFLLLFFHERQTSFREEEYRLADDDDHLDDVKKESRPKVVCACLLIWLVPQPLHIYSVPSDEEGN